jgi:hypothetical protein
MGIDHTPDRGEGGGCEPPERTPLEARPRPQSASGRSSFPAETANGPPAPNRGKSRVFRGDGEFGVSAGLRGGGAGRTRTGNQTIISPSRQVPNQRAQNTACGSYTFQSGARYRCALAPKGFSAECQTRRCVAGKTVTDESSAPHALLGCPPYRRSGPSGAAWSAIAVLLWNPEWRGYLDRPASGGPAPVICR